MKIILIYLMLFCVSINLYSQSDCDCYERLVNLSSYFDAIGNYSKANKSLIQALSYKDEKKWDKLDYRRIGLSFAKTKNYNKTEKYLSKAIATGYSINSIKKIKDLDLFKQSKYWNQLISKSDSLKKNYQANLNLEYRLAIEDITGSDQAIRSFMEVPDSIFAFVDSVNFYRLQDLITQYGFPNQNQHGFSEVEIFHFFLHASMYSEKMQEEVLNLLSEAQQGCLVSEKRIAIIQDRRDVWKNEKPQSLGMWNNWDDKTKYSEIKNIEIVDSLRFDLNLLRLIEQSKIDGRILPKDYQKSKYPSNYFCNYKFKE